MEPTRRPFTGNQLAPVRKCTDCSFAIRGRRRIESSVKWYQTRARVWEVFEFDGNRCPTHGTLLVGACDSDLGGKICAAPITSPSDVRCRVCGRPYRWTISGRERQVQQWSSDGRHVGKIGSIDIYVLHGSIVETGADAVVSCDNGDGEMVSSSAAALSERGGREIAEESIGAPRKLGTAWLTSPGRLPVMFVIHVGVLLDDETTTKEFTKAAVTDCIVRAREKRMKTIAMPAIGRLRGLSEDESIAAMTDGLRAAGDGSPLKIVFVLHGGEEFNIFREKLRAHLAGTGSSPAP